jgi:hypothetical protein
MTGEQAKKIPLNYKSVDMGPLGVMKVHPELAKDLKGVKAVITNNEEIKKFQALMTKADQLWRGSATVLPVGGAFSARNFRSNIWLNYLGGLRSPAPYEHAAELGTKVKVALKSKENAARLVKGDLEGVIKDTLSASDYKTYQQARKHGVIDSSFFNTDVGEAKALAGKQTKKQELNPLNPNNVLLRGGRHANQAIENNARMALYLDRLGKNGGDYAEAAMHVKKYLFDYSDLTPFEQKVLKHVMPFYTFMRKNTPLQLANLATNTGKYTARAHIAQDLTSSNNPDNTPDYLRSSRAVTPSIAKALGLSPDSQGLITNDTPLSAAEDSLAPVIKLVSLIPGVRSAIPESYRATDKGDAAGAVLQVPGGPSAELLKYAAKKATGRDVFTGAPPSDSELMQIAKALTPAAGRSKSAISGPAKASILRAITGIRVSEVK